MKISRCAPARSIERVVGPRVVKIDTVIKIRAVAPRKMPKSALLLCFATAALAQADPDQTRVHCDSTAGDFVIALDRTLSPLGVDRFLELVADNFFDDMLLYRVIPGFLVQFGVAATPSVQAKWQNARFPDEPNKVPFRHGTVSFAGNGKDSRTCHIFVALQPNGNNLGKAMHETTIGHVEDMSAWERVATNFANAAYGDTGSLQGALVAQGNSAAARYTKLDRIRTCKVLAPKKEL